VWAAVDGGAAAVCVLGEVRRATQAAHLGDEVCGVE
jgi:hypothetical protein